MGKKKMKGYEVKNADSIFAETALICGTKLTDEVGRDVYIKIRKVLAMKQTVALICLIFSTYLPSAYSQCAWIADSTLGFSTSPGERGWFSGGYKGESADPYKPADFRRDTNIGGNVGRPPISLLTYQLANNIPPIQIRPPAVLPSDRSISYWEAVGAGPRVAQRIQRTWTPYMTNDKIAADTATSANYNFSCHEDSRLFYCPGFPPTGKKGKLWWSVRRWVSNQDAEVKVLIKIFRRPKGANTANNWADGRGSTLHVFNGNTEVDSLTLAARDTVGFTDHEMPRFNITKGSVVDFAIEPLDSAPISSIAYLHARIVAVCQ